MDSVNPATQQSDWFCPHCKTEAKLDEEDVPRCSNEDCPHWMTIVDQYLH